MNLMIYLETKLDKTTDGIAHAVSLSNPDPKLETKRICGFIESSTTSTATLEQPRIGSGIYTEDASSIVDATAALDMPGVRDFVTHEDLPSPAANIWGSKVKDEPFFAEDKVLSHGQVIGMVYADSALEAQAAARAVKVEYEDFETMSSCQGHQDNVRFDQGTNVIWKPLTPW